MKNLTAEEKAKAYDEALKVIKGNLDALNEIIETGAEVVNIQAIKNCFYRAFPELKENEGDSEDERIKKWLIDTIKSIPDDSIEWDVIDKSRVLDWLEKQKEQKPSINIDQLKSLMLQYLQEAANEKDDSDIEADTDKWARQILGYDFEQKPAEDWRENRKKECPFRTVDGCESYAGVITECNGACSWVVDYPKLKEIQDKKDQKPAEWSEEDERKLNRIYKILGYAADDKGFLTSKRIIGDNEAIELQGFLKSLLERFNLQPKK